MADSELREIRDQALVIAREATALLMSGYRSHPNVTKKGAIDLVTEYDLRAEELLRERLEKTFPAHTVIAEESAGTSNDEYVWYVDPIDGTTNFAHGHPFFAVSLGLCKNSRPIVGVVAAPALQVEWTAARDHGAFRNGARCFVSKTETLNDSLCATGFPYDRRTSDENNLREYNSLLMKVQSVNRCGAASLDMCLVADGTYEAYWEQKLKPWDIAAGIVLVEEAGGKVSNYVGAAANFDELRMLASNGRVHDEMIRALAESRSKIG